LAVASATIVASTGSAAGRRCGALRGFGVLYKACRLTCITRATVVKG